MSASNFQAKLEAFYEAQRRGQVIRELESASTVMRETLLLCEIHEVLFDEPSRPDESVRQRVKSLRSSVETGEFDSIEEEIGDVRSELETERDAIRTALQRELHDIEDRIGGFEALNNRIGKVDHGRIEALRERVDTLDDVSGSGERTLDDRLKQVRNSVEEFLGELEAVESALFEDFRGSDIEDLVRSLLSGNRLTLADREESELKALLQSELGPYVHLSLEDK